MPVEKVVEKVVYVDRPVEKVGLSHLRPVEKVGKGGSFQCIK